MPKLTTNQKLAALANGMENADDYEESQRQKANKAAERLRRTSLYSGGARAQIPNIRSSSDGGSGLFSPFKMNDTPMRSTGIPITTSVPPGSHDMQFRMVTNPTSKSYNDTDRIFFNSSGMQDGVLRIPEQPAWYFGNNNKTKPPDANYAIMGASRYGFRGSKGIRQRHTEPYESASNTKTDHTPSFLARQQTDLTNEWVPPIVAARIDTLNGMESPKLWPENAEFPTGYRLKRAPTSHRYRRETTIDETVRPVTSHSTSTIIDRTVERDMLREYSALEKSGELLSKPLQDRNDFETRWEISIKQDATSTLASTMRKVPEHHEAHALSDHADTLSYSKASAIIVRSKTTEEKFFSMRAENGGGDASYELRWRYILSTLDRIRVASKRNPDYHLFVDDFALQLRKEAMKAGTATSLKRPEFMRAAGKVSVFEGFESKSLSMLYNAFDRTRRNVVQYVNILAAYTVLIRETEDTDTKLARLWDLMETYGNDKSQLEKALSCLTVVCANEKEHADMVELFKAQFRPTCYRQSIQTTSADFGQDSDHDAGSPKKKPGLSAQPAYNIVDNYMTVETFVKTVQASPFVSNLFDRLLGERLISFYGKDPRPKQKNQPQERKGAKFKWMNNSAQ